MLEKVTEHSTQLFQRATLCVCTIFWKVQQPEKTTVGVKIPSLLWNEEPFTICQSDSSPPFREGTFGSVFQIPPLLHNNKLQYFSILVHQHVNTNLFLCLRQIKSSTTQDRGSAYLGRLVLMVQSKHKINTFQSDAQPTKRGSYRVKSHWIMLSWWTKCLLFSLTQIINVFLWGWIW